MESSSGTPSSRVIRNALREKRLLNFGLCSIRLRRHGPFMSCFTTTMLCFALSGTHLGSSFFSLVSGGRIGGASLQPVTFLSL